jgi:cytochrome c peroxidase
VNTNELGNLGLTKAEEAAIVAFVKTLSDGFIPGGRGKHLR